MAFAAFYSYFTCDHRLLVLHQTAGAAENRSAAGKHKYRKYEQIISLSFFRSSNSLRRGDGDNFRLISCRQIRRRHQNERDPDRICKQKMNKLHDDRRER